jgi:hypothetical protein
MEHIMRRAGAVADGQTELRDQAPGSRWEAATRAKKDT